MKKNKSINSNTHIHTKRKTTLEKYQQEKLI